MGAIVLLSRHGRQPTHAAALSLRMFPEGNHGREGHRVWLYAIGFSDGRIKIGIARRPRERLRGYWNACGGAIEWVHLFGQAPTDSRHGAQHPVERRAIESASQIAQRIGRTEYFTGLSKADALRCVREALAQAIAGS